MKISIEMYGEKVEYTGSDECTGVDALENCCKLLIASGFHRDTVRSALEELSDDDCYDSNSMS